MELVKNAWRLVAPVQRESVHVNIDVTYLNAVIAAFVFAEKLRSGDSHGDINGSRGEANRI